MGKTNGQNHHKKAINPGILSLDLWLFVSVTL